MSAGDASPERVYLDYGGFAPVDPRVLAVMRPFLEAGIGNPSAPHSLGAEARAALEAARVKVARLCGGAATGVIFTSGATEANNLAIRGVARAARARARVIVSSVEHVSVVNACRELERGGAEVVTLPVDCEGRVVLDALRRALGTEAALVSIGAASGEIGTLQPLGEIGRLTRAAGVPLHVDAVGALGRVPLAVDAMGIDLLTLSGNDIYGPPGTGALWVRPELKIRPQILGGGQEGGYRAGTENLPALVGFGVAAELMRTEGGHGEATRLAALRDQLLEELLDTVVDCRLTGPRSGRLPHHLSVVLRGVERRERATRPRPGGHRGVLGVSLRLAHPDALGHAPRHRLRARRAGRPALLHARPLQHGAPMWRPCSGSCRLSWRGCARSRRWAAGSPCASSSSTSTGP